MTFHFQDQCFVPVIARKSPFLCLNKGPIRNGFRACARATRYGVKIALARSQGPEEMCLSLEHQNPSKTSEKMGYFDRVTVSLHILQTANQETEGSQDRREYGLRLLRIWLAVISKVDVGQIRNEEIVYSKFIKIPLG